MLDRQERVASEEARVSSEPDRSLLDRTASLAGARSLAPAPAAFEVVSPDPQVRWRVGSGSSVARSVLSRRRRHVDDTGHRRDCAADRWQLALAVGVLARRALRHRAAL